MDNIEVIAEKKINCSFCGKGRHQVEQIVEGPVIDGRVLYICIECIDETHMLLHKEEAPIIKKKIKIPSPEQVKAALDEYIIGQDDAKIAVSVAVYNHYKRINNKSTTEIEKSNLLMVGESGCGKTLTVKTIAKMFDIPYVIGDATTLTEAGYVGDDVQDLVKRLIQNAGDDLEKAETGIIFIDEIDKKNRRGESATAQKDVSGEGVQQALLKLIEGTIITIEEGYDSPVKFDTKNILFICSGAFVGLDDIIRKNRSKSSIGIGATLNTKIPFSQVVKSATPEDFIKYGLIPEFVGRCPITVVFDDLTVDILIRILKEPKNSITEQFRALFDYDEVSLVFDDKYLHNVSEECLKQKIGARGLRSILEKNLQSIQYALPRLAKEGINKIYINADGTPRYMHKAVKKAVNE